MESPRKAPSDTERMDERAREMMAREHGPRATLVLYHREGAEAVPLALGAVVVVGRAAPSDIAVDDASLSRQHARFTLLDDGIYVEDMGSTNGTWLAGKAVDRERVRPGEEVLLGAVRATVHELGPSYVPAGLSSHERMLSALEVEITRARHFGRQAALMLVRAAPGVDGHLRNWWPRVQAELRSVDSAALYSQATLEVLLPELDAAAAASFAERLTAAGGPRLVAGVAALPGAGTSAEQIVDVCRAALEAAGAARPVVVAPEGSRVLGGATPDDEGPVWESPAMQAVVRTAGRLARGVVPVLLQGETGTGKEVLARFLHESGPRRAGPLVCVNCGAIASQLLESTLFGHERGAFTGADRQHRGVFETADGGTVLLDEIGELPAVAQVALLRVLETKRLVRVGGTREVEVDVRILAATHRDLEAMVVAGGFRQDLLFRLNAMTLTIPPLRERREDVAALARRFLLEASRANECSVREIGADAMQVLEAYAWPGNVRELRNVVHRAVVIAESDVVGADDLPERARAAVSAPPGAPGARPRTRVPAPEAGHQEDDFRTTMERLEVEVLTGALERAGWNQTETARRLKMPLRTLQHKIAAHGIKRPPEA